MTYGPEYINLTFTQKNDEFSMAWLLLVVVLLLFSEAQFLRCWKSVTSCSVNTIIEHLRRIRAFSNFGKTTCKHSLFFFQVWLYLVRILVHNGLGVFVTWITLASLLNLNVVIVYYDSPNTPLPVSRGKFHGAKLWTNYFRQTRRRFKK